jgi:hypothetical protein
VPLLPELQVGFFERGACERESSTVVDDDVVAEVMSIAIVEAIVEEDLVELSVVWEDCIFSCFSPRSRSCSSSQPALPIVSECKDISVIMAPVMQMIP